MPEVIVITMEAVHEGSNHKLITNPGPHACPPPTPATPFTPMPLPVIVQAAKSYSAPPPRLTMKKKKVMTAKGPAGPSFSDNKGKQPGSLPPFDLVAAGVPQTPTMGKDRALMGAPNVMLGGGMAAMTGSPCEANTMA